MKKILIALALTFTTACSTMNPETYQTESGCFSDQAVKTVYSCNHSGCTVALKDGTYAKTSFKKIKSGDRISITEQCSNLAH